MTVAQFDVFSNPIPAARHAYPFVMTLQADFATDSPGQIVAPLVPRSSMAGVIGRLTPVVHAAGAEHVVLVTAMTGVPTRDLGGRILSLVSARNELLAAIDYLFFGV